MASSSGTGTPISPIVTTPSSSASSEVPPELEEIALSEVSSIRRSCSVSSPVIVESNVTKIEEVTSPPPPVTKIISSNVTNVEEVSSPLLQGAAPFHAMQIDHPADSAHTPTPQLSPSVITSRPPQPSSSGSTARSFVTSMMNVAMSPLSNPSNMGIRVALYLGIAAGDTAIEALLFTLVGLNKMPNMNQKDKKFLADETATFAVAMICLAFSWVCAVYLSIKPTTYPLLRTCFYFVNLWGPSLVMIRVFIKWVAWQITALVVSTIGIVFFLSKC